MRSQQSKRVWRAIALGGALLFGGQWEVSAALPCVSLIVDVYGQVSLAEKSSARAEQRWPASLFQCVTARSVMWFEAGAGATLYFPASGVAYETRGPGQYQVATDQLQALGDAARPRLRPMADEFKKLRLDRADLTPGGIRMRTRSEDDNLPKAVAPRGIVIFEGPLRFTWRTGTTSAPHRLRIARRDLSTLYESSVQGEAFELPDSVVLTPGESLLWQIDGAGAAGTLVSDRVEFIIATPAARALARQLDQTLQQPAPAQDRLREVLLRQVMEQDK